MRRFMTIEDFKSRPCPFEYLTLYFSFSISLITGTACVFGQIQSSWAILILFLLIGSGSFLLRCKYKRQSLAEGFYREWLENLPPAQVKELAYCLKSDSREYAMLMCSTYRYSLALEPEKRGFKPASLA
uniref:hypothetical protein n=1 Tax=Ningiella ruwaisensis TaxID=2364274 RepID=UPI00109FCD85|nr:hypothetical protein [Ningiella ruwaisensis]